MNDLEIARSTVLQPVSHIADELDLDSNQIETYGRHKAKVSLSVQDALSQRPDGKLILVTAMSPTTAGEGKTTTSIGLADALRRRGKRAVLALREPSLGPVFGMKGGATGGGHAQIVPREDINLHFTGDFHAITSANNLLAAMVDNHVYQGNSLGLDPRSITWRRCLDMNDRQLRFAVSGLGGKSSGTPREDGFDITAASEVMATFCMAKNLDDLRRRLGSLIIGSTYEGVPVTAAQLNAAGAMTALLKDAIKPNLVQTLEHTPALVHGGPFANIAHGCNSVIATRMALKLGDYVVTEAGFGADLGAEKFLDIKCRSAGLAPSAVVLVASIRALKLHGGHNRDDLGREDLRALERGVPNLEKHLENLGKFGLKTVVAINRFPEDTAAEIRLVEERCRALGARVALSEVWARGGEGALDLADEVARMADAFDTGEFRYLYELNLPLREKIETVAREIYGADGVDFSPRANNDMKRIERLGFGGLPVCIAKTQYSFSDDPKKLGRPTGFRISVSRARISAGAGFVVVHTGDIMTMPGLPAVPAAERITMDADGAIDGLW